MCQGTVGLLPDLHREELMAHGAAGVVGLLVALQVHLTPVRAMRKAPGVDRLPAPLALEALGMPRRPLCRQCAQALPVRAGDRALAPGAGGDTLTAQSPVEGAACSRGCGCQQARPGSSWRMLLLRRLLGPWAAGVAAWALLLLRLWVLVGSLCMTATWSGQCRLSRLLSRYSSPSVPAAGQLTTRPGRSRQACRKTSAWVPSRSQLPYTLLAPLELTHGISTAAMSAGQQGCRVAATGNLVSSTGDCFRQQSEPGCYL